VQSQNAELHRLRWEQRSKAEEIRELQQALSSAKLYLFDEREVALKLAAENEELKAQEAEDRQRIAHLLALTEPMTQEVRPRSCASLPILSSLCACSRSFPPSRPPSLPPSLLALQFTFFRSTVPAASAPVPAGSAPAPAAKAGSKAEAALGRSGFALRPAGSSPGSSGAAGASSSKSSSSAGPVSFGGGAGRLVRSVELGSSTGSSSSAGAELRLASALQQLQSLQKLCDERGAAQAREKASLQEEAAKRAKADACTISALEQQVEALQAKLTHLTRGERRERPLPHSRLTSMPSSDSLSPSLPPLLFPPSLFLSLPARLPEPAPQPGQG
jgi:hypothetical protein